MNTTFTIQSVHGLSQTFVLGPGGAVTNVPASQSKERQTESQNDRRDDKDRD